jgi:hypothetical protein
MLHWNDLRADAGKLQKHGARVNALGYLQLSQMPPTLATIDHLRDRLHPDRNVETKNQEQRWVLACWKCNNDRGQQRVAEQPIEELWRRSGRTAKPIVDEEEPRSWKRWLMRSTSGARFTERSRPSPTPRIISNSLIGSDGNA